MAPTPEPFLPADLATRVQITAEGKRRKTAVDLEKCSLRELVQYNCNIEKRGDVVCVPVSRWFRRCANGLTVETSAWAKEGRGLL